MSQKYLQIFKDCADKQYAAGITPLMALSELNDNVSFTPIPIKGSETVNVTPSFVIQRARRVKASDSKQDAAKGAGDNFTERLNSAQNITWDSITTIQSKKRDLLVKYAQDQAMDFLTNPAAYQSVIANIATNEVIEAEEIAEANVYAAGTLNTNKLVVDGTKDKEVIEFIMSSVKNVQLTVDDFKAYSNTMIVLIHPYVADCFARVQGQSYMTGTNTFPNGLGQSFTYSGIQFFVSNILNTIVGTAKTEVAGAIVMDREAYKNGGPSLLLKPINQIILDERVVGHSYAFIDVIVDKARIVTFEMTKPAGLNDSKKVNA